MPSHNITLGLRIDVDTLRGTKLGVPNLLDVLAGHNLLATFFFSVGPDNMGRHLRRLLQPKFFIKMLRSKAGSLYGWDIILRGTLWPGPIIGLKCGQIIRRTAEAGHEIGFHAWDHHRWQVKADTMSPEDIRLEINKGISMLEKLIGRPVKCSAVPGWRCTDSMLREKERFSFQYNSDCRGHSIFHPKTDGYRCTQPQIPVTLPTYDEVIGTNGISNDHYNDYILSLIKPHQLNVLTIHAEAEGIRCLTLFQDFLEKCQRKKIRIIPLKNLIKDSCQDTAEIIPLETEGREGWVSWQARNKKGPS